MSPDSERDENWQLGSIRSLRVPLVAVLLLAVGFFGYRVFDSRGPATAAYSEPRIVAFIISLRSDVIDE